MNSRDKVCYLDESGRIMLPPDILRSLGWEPGMALTLYSPPVDSDALIIARLQPVCVFCGTSYALWPYVSKHVCSDCRRALSRLI